MVVIKYLGQEGLYLVVMYFIYFFGYAGTSKGSKRGPKSGEGKCIGIMRLTPRKQMAVLEAIPLCSFYISVKNSQFKFKRSRPREIFEEMGRKIIYCEKHEACFQYFSKMIGRG